MRRSRTTGRHLIGTSCFYARLSMLVVSMLGRIWGVGLLSGRFIVSFCAQSLSEKPARLLSADQLCTAEFVSLLLMIDFLARQAPRPVTTSSNTSKFRSSFFRISFFSPHFSFWPHCVSAFFFTPGEAPRLRRPPRDAGHPRGGSEGRG